MAQSVEHPPLDFGSGHDLMVHEIEPRGGACAEGPEPAWDSLSLSVCLSSTCTLCLCLSLKINIKKTQNYLKKE